MLRGENETSRMCVEVLSGKALPNVGSDAFKEIDPSQNGVCTDPSDLQTVRLEYSPASDRNVPTKGPIWRRRYAYLIIRPDSRSRLEFMLVLGCR
jgi:hypothetical protein